MSLVDVDSGEVVEVLSADDARSLIGRMRGEINMLKRHVTDLYEGRAWLALGYESWDELCDAELDGFFVLPRADRQAFHIELRTKGMSTRAIAAVTGVSDGTVRNDLTGAQDYAPVTGTDGKTYPATKPTISVTERESHSITTTSPAPEAPADHFKCEHCGDEFAISAGPYDEATADHFDAEVEYHQSGDCSATGEADDREASDSDLAVAPSPVAPDPEADALAEYLDDDSDAAYTRALWQKNFAKHWSAGFTITRFEVDDVAAKADPEDLDLIDLSIELLNEWWAKVRAARYHTPLRSIAGGKS